MRQLDAFFSSSDLLWLKGSRLVNSGLQRQRAQRGAQGRPPQGRRQKLQPLEGVVAPAPGGGVARQRPLCAGRPLLGLHAARWPGLQRCQFPVWRHIRFLFSRLWMLIAAHRLLQVALDLSNPHLALPVVTPRLHPGAVCAVYLAK